MASYNNSRYNFRKLPCDCSVLHSLALNPLGYPARYIKLGVCHLLCHTLSWLIRNFGICHSGAYPAAKRRYDKVETLIFKSSTLSYLQYSSRRAGKGADKIHIISSVSVNRRFAVNSAARFGAGYAVSKYCHYIHRPCWRKSFRRPYTPRRRRRILCRRSRRRKRYCRRLSRRSC